ncbi:hypothetical protein PhaeoP83_02214 [Phaeobacter inhibens]|uniref:Uncharacterized protein n=1 Tax=Phaeobacter inhibens TaxID=221822 RepID=A0ABN5GN88_9RHOB|nr:hypothetical protein [Phaeobacter inhibens]AUQ50479.1 hypothetical protein PhaeoP83_02214 [Phaeobacter inhibens]AUQ95019.1 hypothetical protein PhaeoP66_02246 [Phaeobacter inhibens]AUR20284.1 hypothetical protein PhaeoP80_02214 [Phaeobacter inhibens]
MTVILPFTRPAAGDRKDRRADIGTVSSHQPTTGPGASVAGPVAPWVESFARHRRSPQDVYWLKENAELLSLLRVMQQRVGEGAGVGDFRDEAALSPLRPFYDRAARQLRFFPQYYRFILSICLDYEDLIGTGRLGPDTRAAELAHWVAHQGLVEAEMSDLQRAEARQLLARRGIAVPVDPGLDDRLRRFARRSQTFAIPNRKAAYELTHIVFYLSDYGRRDPGLDGEVQRSLTYAGLLACLDQDVDLLSEICIALRYCGVTPPPLWEQALARAAGGFVITPDGFDGHMDGYHVYFVTLWWQQISAPGEPPLGADTGRLQAGGGRAIHIAAPSVHSLLRPLSLWLMEDGDDAQRSAADHWRAALTYLTEWQGQEAADQLLKLKLSTPEFGDFWQIFSRRGKALHQTCRITSDGISLTGHAQ